MVLKYFPEDRDDQGFILERYADEIQLRANWIINAAEEVNKSLSGPSVSASLVIKNSMDLIGHAMVILRIIDPAGSRRNELERAAERVNLLKEKWPKIPSNPPQGLRDVRNDYEHFDARLDQWAVSSNNRLIADKIVGPAINGFETHENLRRFEGGTLYFWDNAVNLSEVVRWAQQVAAAVSE